MRALSFLIMLKNPTLKQQGALLHPQRIRIVGEFLFSTGLTAAALRERLPELSQATLYRHLAALTDAGILAVRETRQKRGGTERTYILAINPALDMREVAAVPQRLLYIVSTAAAVLLRVFSHYVTHGHISKRKVDPMLRFYWLYATDDEYRTLAGEIHRLLYDAAKAGSKPSKGRRSRVFFLAAVPESEWNV